MCKNQKMLCEAKLNSLIANDNINEYITNFNQTAPNDLNGVTIEKGVHLVKIIANNSAFGHPAGIPFFAFEKKAGKFSVLADITSGKVQMFEGDSLRSVSRVKGNFSINGITYGLKDTLNNFPRYHAIRRSGEKRNNHFSPGSYE